MSSKWRVLVVTAVLLYPAVSSAQGVSSNRGWVDVTFGSVGSAAKATTFVFVGELFEEPLTLEASYPKPSATFGVDFGGGIMFTRMVGAGVNFEQATFKDPADVSITVPHPFFFDAFGTGTANTTNDLNLDDLKRKETSFHIQIMVVAMRTDKLVVRIFGGPTFFSYKADMVRDIEFTQNAPSNSVTNIVTVTGVDIVEAKGNSVGFHAGGDVTFLLTPNVGIGGVVRFSRGTVTLDSEPMSEVEQDIKVGGFKIGGGLKLFF
jgi:hypothetical protein